MGKYVDLVEKTISFKGKPDVEKLAKKLGGKKVGKNTYKFEETQSVRVFGSKVSDSGHYDAMVTDNNGKGTVEVTEPDYL